MGNSKIPAHGHGCGPGVPVARVITAPTIPVDYNVILNKPSINGVVLVGDVSSEELGLDELDPSDFATDADVDSLFG